MTDTKTPTATKFKQDLMQDPSIRTWVKVALNDLENKDALDALRDVSLVKKYCEMRLNEIQEYYK